MRNIKFNFPTLGEITVTVKTPIATPHESYLELAENVHNAALDLVDGILTATEATRRKEANYFLYLLIESCIRLQESVIANCEEIHKIEKDLKCHH